MPPDDVTIPHVTTLHQHRPSSPGIRDTRETILAYREQFARFSRELQRPVVIDVPHGELLRADRASHYRMATDDGTPMPADAMTISFYTGPMPEDHSARHTLIGMGTYRGSLLGDTDTDYGVRVMFDGINPSLSGTYDHYTDAATVGESFANQTGLEFWGTVNLYEILCDVMRRDSVDRRITDDGRAQGAFAYVFSNLITIPFDFVHGNDAGRFLEQFLVRLAAHVNDLSQGTPEERKERMAEAIRKAAEEQRKREREHALQSLNDYTDGLRNELLRAAERNVEMLDTEIENHRLRYFSKIRERDQSMIQLAGLRASGEDPNQEHKVNAIIEMLDKGTITSFERNRGTAFTFGTRHILIKDERTDAYHNIGRFKVTVDLSTGDITFRNSVRRVRGYNSDMHHPHVFSNGNACLGNFSEMMAPIVANKDWFTSISMILAFLESANTGDVAGRLVHNWPFEPNPEEYGYPAYPEGETPEPYDYPGDDEEEE